VMLTSPCKYLLPWIFWMDRHLLCKNWIESLQPRAWRSQVQSTVGNGWLVGGAAVLQGAHETRGKSGTWSTKGKSVL
jgi:hypothetical protein